MSTPNYPGPRAQRPYWNVQVEGGKQALARLAPILLPGENVS